MARQVFYEVREKDVLLHERFLYLRAALEWAKAHVRGLGEAGSAYLTDPENHAEVLVTSRRIITIDEVS